MADGTNRHMHPAQQPDLQPTSLPLNYGPMNVDFKTLFANLKHEYFPGQTYSNNYLLNIDDVSFAI